MKDDNYFSADEDERRECCEAVDIDFTSLSVACTGEEDPGAAIEFLFELDRPTVNENTRPNYRY